LSEIETPAVVIDASRLEANIERMAAGTRDMGVALRPHFKTHKTLEIVRKQLAAGAVGITCAKSTEAEVLIDAGVPDVFIANEVVGPAKVERLLGLSGRAALSVGVDDVAQAVPLSQAFATQERTLPVLIEVDTGVGRCGLPPGERVVELARKLTALPGIEFRGLFTHEGHVYAARSPEELEAMALDAGRAMVRTAEQLDEAGIPCPVVSVGATPSAFLTPRVAGVTEVRPGSYVFYDRCHIRAWSATEEDLALSVLATVISRPDPARLVVDAGTKVLSADHAGSWFDTFGTIVGRPRWRLIKANEEHGIIEVPSDDPAEIGQVIEIRPNHNCAVMNLTDEVYVVRDNLMKARWQVAARGCSR
jgi:D-serine deaminase-like pyridoxal phosphate-dependent protein